MDYFTGMKEMFSKIFKSRSTQAFSGYKKPQFLSPSLDVLSDTELQELNHLLNWKCFTADPKGRMFGNIAANDKRSSPQPLQDKRIILMNEKFDLKQKSVLEVGCFEGVHTIGLCQFSPNVIAIDSRIENIVKTMVRTGFYGCYPRVFLADLENLSPEQLAFMKADVLHHVGVLYHLDI